MGLLDLLLHQTVPHPVVDIKVKADLVLVLKAMVPKKEAENPEAKSLLPSPEADASRKREALKFILNT